MEWGGDGEEGAGSKVKAKAHFRPKHWRSETGSEPEMQGETFDGRGIAYLRTCCIWGASGTSTWQCSSDVTELELSEKLRARAVELGFIPIPEAIEARGRRC